MRQQLESLVREMVGKGIPLEMARQELEKAYIRQVLLANRGNQSATARKLGMHRNTLARKLESPEHPRPHV